MRGLLPILVAALALAPPAARSADLVVWWQKGFYAQEDTALAEIVAAFEQATGKQVQLVQPGREITDHAQAALEAGLPPPDFLFGVFIERWLARWAHEDRLVDLEAVLGPLLNLFDADAVAVNVLRNGKTGEFGLYALPIGRRSNHIHVWNSLLEKAGFTRADIPSDWEAFWSFWCDEVQPAVRAATGRDDIWGVGLSMSAGGDTLDQLSQFQLAYGAHWLDSERNLQVDDPAVRAGMIEALDDYSAIFGKGCTPPDSVSWTAAGNNEAFLAQTVVMTPNSTLSIPGALRTSRPEDYYDKAITVEWPNGIDGRPLVIIGFVSSAVLFKNGEHRALAEEFVRFLVEDGWLAHWLNFAGDRFLPPMRKLVEQPFWLDPGDPHRLRAAMQILTRRHLIDAGVRGKGRQSSRIWDENLWGEAVHRVVTEGVTPEQAVDEAIARIKQILAE